MITNEVKVSYHNDGLTNHRNNILNKIKEIMKSAANVDGKYYDTGGMAKFTEESDNSVSFSMFDKNYKLQVINLPINNEAHFKTYVGEGAPGDISYNAIESLSFFIKPDNSNRYMAEFYIGKTHSMANHNLHHLAGEYYARLIQDQIKFEEYILAKLTKVNSHDVDDFDEED